MEDLKVRPYARLLTMLGEQLIKNDRIALVELIKNSYDADALDVSVDFMDFSPTLENYSSSRIAIIDNGVGMTEAVIRNHWVNPATPVKAKGKLQHPTSRSGRVIQGEKGIGRFAMFKLGNSVRIVTRPEHDSREYVIVFDLSMLDDSGSSLTASEPGPGDDGLFIEDLSVQLSSREPEIFDGFNPDGLHSDHGMRVEISGLRSAWRRTGVERAYADVARLQPIVPYKLGDQMADVPESDASPLATFKVDFCADGLSLGLEQSHNLELKELFSERAVLRVSGYFSIEERSYLLEVNDHTSLVSLDDPEVAGLWAFQRYFGSKAKPARDSRLIECGSFNFSFYIFDLSAQAPDTFKLDRDEKGLVKEHRIYLYRDGVRVLPYGDPDDDWLQLDVIRGTQGADKVLSNDQTVGFVYITQAANPSLQDKTNREGLLDSGHALDDFVALLQIVVSHLRAKDFARYRLGLQNRRSTDSRRRQEVLEGFRNVLENTEIPEKARRQIARLEAAYREEQDHFQTRLDRTEDLAGVGLSVESASHDIFNASAQAVRMSRSVANLAKRDHPEEFVLCRDSQGAAEAIVFVDTRLQDVQGLFVSTRQPRRRLDPTELVSRVYRIYGYTIREHGVELEIRGERSLRVDVSEAALLQVLVNLFDNSIYWMSVSKTQRSLIVATVDPVRRRLIISDSGPGVQSEDEPYIFEPFYSGRGQDGRGLGLYIARQVAARGGFAVRLAATSAERVLSGANFVVDFGGTGGD